MMEQLNGEVCFLLFVAVTLTHHNGRGQCGWTIRGEEETRKDVCIA